VVLGQADAKSPASHDRVEARGRLGVGETNEGRQKQAGKRARSKSDATVKNCKDRKNLGPPLKAPGG
jgi:hypothetical protein